MVSRVAELEFSPSNRKYEIEIKDDKPYARENTYLSSHCLLTAILFYEFFSPIDLQKKGADPTFEVGEFVYAMLHHDDGKNTSKWQNWFLQQRDKKDWTNYKDHADDRLFDDTLHSKEQKLLQEFQIPLKKNCDLAKWVMRNHHPHKQLDSLSLRLERLFIVLADHASAKIESEQSSSDFEVNPTELLKDNWLYGHIFAYYHPDLIEKIAPLKVHVTIKPKMEENIF